MNYRPRFAEKKLLDYARHFKIVLITGARQVGKSTLLSHTFPDTKSIVFDPVQDIHGAKEDPDLFLNNFKAPVILDEIQYAPELLAAIKRRVDRSDQPGQYFLTGSQNLSVLRDVSESLAGRVGILHLDSMTHFEMSGCGARGAWLERYLSDPDGFASACTDFIPETGGLARFLWRGGFPGLLDIPDEMVGGYLASYIQTYVERDVRRLENIRELAAFSRFLGLAGALTGQEINASQLGRDVGVKPSTARSWLGLLTHSYQWLELFPYQGSAVKRLSGRKKGCLCDTGLACALQRISSPDALAVSPLLGALFETMAVNLIHRQFILLPLAPQAYHWRTGAGAEVDTVLEWNGRLYPIEVKCSTKLSRHDTRGLRAFRETYAGRQIMKGLIIYAGDQCYSIDEHTIALPWNAAVEQGG